MSEEHGADCAESVKNSDEKINEDSYDTVKVTESVETDGVGEPSANSDQLAESAINVKESLNSEVDEKESLYGANDSVNNRLTWTVEEKQFKVTWNLQEYSATTKDYIALCLAGAYKNYFTCILLVHYF